MSLQLAGSLADDAQKPSRGTHPLEVTLFGCSIWAARLSVSRFLASVGALGDVAFWADVGRFCRTSDPARRDRLGRALQSTYGAQQDIALEANELTGETLQAETTAVLSDGQCFELIPRPPTACIEDAQIRAEERILQVHLPGFLDQVSRTAAAAEAKVRC